MLFRSFGLADIRVRGSLPGWAISVHHSGPIQSSGISSGCDGLKVLPPGLSRRAVPQFCDQPLLVVFLDEVPHSDAHLFDVLKNPSIDGLFFQGAVEPLGDSVGFRLADKRKAGLEAPILGLVQEMVRPILGVMAQEETMAFVGVGLRLTDCSVKWPTRSVARPRPRPEGDSLFPEYNPRS